MDSCVVDSNVVSYFFKNSPVAQFYHRHLLGKLLIISFMTLAEIRFGMLQAGWGARRIATMEAYLKNFVLYASDSDLCDVWARVVYSERAKGRIISTQDAWIAATAIQNKVPLITHNRKHFEGVDNLVLVSEAAG
jgi:tRNA(fMet)-specific endonuclease VapC